MLDVQTLYEGPWLHVHDVTCRAGCGVAEEEPSTSWDVVLPRWGFFVRQVGGERSVADANHALFYARGEVHRVSHPIPGGDRCTSLTVSSRRLREVLAAVDPRAAEASVLRLPASVPTSARVDLRHRALVRGLRAGATGLAVEETALGIVAALLGVPEGPDARARRSATRRHHAEVVEHTCAELGRRLHEKLHLAPLARAVHTSPFHLSRVFRAHTGLTLHRYHERLRLRAALERLLEGPCDLAGLALEHGFSHHSHFTHRFRREIGLPPSAVAAQGYPARKAEKSSQSSSG